MQTQTVPAPIPSILDDWLNFNLSPIKQDQYILTTLYTEESVCQWDLNQLKLLKDKRKEPSKDV